MKYLQHYCALMRVAENRETPAQYTERHHIWPKSIFGNNSRVVRLTAREHFVAHLLLEKGLRQRYGNTTRTRKALHAVIYMGQKYKNSKLYATARERFVEQMSGEGAPRAKLTEVEVQVIRWYYKRRRDFTNITQESLAKYFEVDVGVLGKLTRRQTWKNVEDIELLPEKYNYLPLLIKLGVVNPTST